MFVAPFPNQPGQILFLEVILLRNKGNTELCVNLCQREDPRGTGHAVVSCIDLKGLQDGKPNFFWSFSWSTGMQQCWFKAQTWEWSSASLRRGRGDTLPHSSSCLELSTLREELFWRSFPTPGDTSRTLLHPGLADCYPKL